MTTRLSQDDLLNRLSGGKVPVTLYLLTGIRLVGRIESTDRHGVFFTGEQTAYVYKQAIATIVPSTTDPLSLTDPPAPRAIKRPTRITTRPGRG